MDFPNISNHQRSQQISSRGGYHVNTPSHRYGAVESSFNNGPDHQWSSGSHHHHHYDNNYRYAPCAAGESQIAPYRYHTQSRGRPHGYAPEESYSGRLVQAHDRTLVYRDEPTNTPARAYGDNCAEMKPRCAPYKDPYLPKGTNDEQFYPPTVQDRRHYPGKSMYDPEIPSLADSEHSFEVTSDDDDENMWDRKFRPEEKMRLSNEYFSEDEQENYYSAQAAKPRVPPVVKVAPIPSKQQIEIFPGVWLPLRGAQETWAAVQIDFYIPSECLCCETTILFIQDAAFVLCPRCKTVGPGCGDDSMAGGVGLGFTMEELAKWQLEIERSRKESAKRMM
jgi:hypothetical protein